MIEQERYSLGFAIRFVVYLIAVMALFELLVILVRKFGWDRVILEGGVVELLQLGIIFLTIAGLLILAVKWVESRGIYVLMICISGMAAIRETDESHWLTAAIRPWQTWAIAIAIFLMIAFVFRRDLLRRVQALISRPSFLLFVLGFFLVAAWAQTLAQKELFGRKADRCLEELLELSGYVLIFAGVIEEYIAQWRNPAGREKL